MLRKILYSLCLTAAILLPVQAESFTDVSSSHKNYQAIESLKQSGIIQGYSDGTYKPDQNINRAESLKIIMLGSGHEVELSQATDAFSDVSKSDWFSPYIQKAKNLAIVRGNPDGSFSPARNVNLAESLKILLLSNGVKISVSPPVKKPYADVQVSQWFAPYFVYAKENKLLDTPSSNLINPGLAISRADLAELMWRLRKVLSAEDRDLSYASFYSDALQGNTTASGDKYDKNKFTAAHKELPFGSRVEVTNLNNNKSVIVKINDRGPFVEGRVIDLSKAAFEAISPLSKGVIPVSLKVIDKQELNFQDNSLISDCSKGEKYDSDFFHYDKSGLKIDLYSDLYSKYFENQVIDISGKVNDSDASYAIVVIKDENGYERQFKSPIKSGDFMVQVDFMEAGDKTMIIVTDKDNVNYQANISVIKGSCGKSDDTDAASPSNYRYVVDNNTTIFRWDIDEGQNLSRLMFSQGENRVVKYLSDSKTGIKLDPVDFELFAVGEVDVIIESAYSSDASLFNKETTWKAGEVKSYTISEHHFSSHNTADLEINDLPDTFIKGGEISFGGKNLVDMNASIAIIMPDGSIENMDFTTDASKEENQNGIEIYKPGAVFSFVYHPKNHGVHIIEINNDQGLALLNYPVYESGSLPLIPDFIDLRYAQIANKVTTVDNVKFSNDLLILVNQERKAAGLSLVELDDSLTSLAQARASDMKQNNYFSHWDKNGEDANDWRIDYAIKTSVSENIAKDINVSYAHAGLMRSAVHRQNILGDEWSKVGFGFEIAEDGALIVVEIFSSEAIETDDLPKLREDVLDYINSKREELFLPSASLNSLAQSWSDKMALNNFFDFTDPNTNVTLREEILKGGVTQTVGTYIVGNTSYSDLLEMLSEHNELHSSRWEKLGVGIAQDNDGVIKMTLLYSE